MDATPNFQEFMKTNWADTHMKENIGEKIQQCGVGLTHWANKEFGSISKRKKKLYNQMTSLQNCEASNVRIQELNEVEAELDSLLKREETMWFQRSRALWLKDGDKNSKNFHQKATNRKIRNTIKNIRTEEGNEVKK